MKFLIILASLISIAFSTEVKKCSDEHFNQFMVGITNLLNEAGIQIDLNLNLNLLSIRKTLFKANCNRIESDNKKFSFKQELNEFAVMTDSEKKNHQGVIPPRNRTQNPSFVSNTLSNLLGKQAQNLPQNFDWRDLGVVTGVKNQKNCGCCWAFSALASLESAMIIQKRTPIGFLSEQELVDCSAKECFGGYMDEAFRYIKASRGIAKSQSYFPYSEKKNICSRNTNTQIGGTVDRWIWISGGEEAMRQELYFKGPIATSIFLTPSFYNYKSGIFYDPACRSDTVSHGITVVGYGTENGFDYWIVKNSWGPLWGENGYFRLARNFNNHCGISSFPLYPIV